MPLVHLVTHASTLLILLLSLGTQSVQGASREGSVLNILSGEQIQVIFPDGQRRQIKLLGINTSSLSRAIRADAKTHLAMLVAGRRISIEYQVVMANGVILGTVKHGGADIALRMLKAGLARVAEEAHLDPETRQHYLAAETLARSRRVGLWHQLQWK